MERYTQNPTQVIQRYIVVGFECILFYLGLQIGGQWFEGSWAASEFEGTLLEYMFTLIWIGGGALLHYFSLEAIYHRNFLLKSSLINLGLLTFVALILFKSQENIQIGFLFTLAAGVLVAAGFRFLLAFLYRHRRIFFSMIGEEYKVMIVGSGETAHELDQFFQKVRGSKIYHYIDHEADESTAIQKLRNQQDEFHQYCLDQNVSEIYYTLPLEATDVIEEMADFADNHYIQFKVANDFNLRTKYKDLSVAFFDQTPIISLRKDPLAQVSNRVIKRLFDLVFSTLVLFFVMPWLLLIIGIAIRLDSKGPILYLQKRSGRKNRPFVCFKFRTMYVQQEGEETSYKQASKDDPRITKVGAFLRKTNLDEFPQFFNVFLGDMSVVGPRPHPLKLNNQYIPIIKKYPFRYFITPGITGHAQVNGYRGETKDPDEMKKRIEYDSWYIQNWSFWLDLKIILQTVFKMSTGDENAY